jgi:hypothetical protein
MAKTAVFLAGLFFGGAIDHVILAAAGRPETRTVCIPEWLEIGRWLRSISRSLEPAGRRIERLNAGAR